MAPTVDLWTPPPGMSALHVRGWRAFYSHLMDVYKITPVDYRLLYVAQKGRCWICRTAKGIHPDDPKARGSRRLGVDHDHLTGAVRGLLCTGGDKTCNRIIGWLTGTQLRRAADYLENRTDRARPARVIPVLRRQIAAAETEGVQLTQAEIDALAQAYLWPADVFEAAHAARVSRELELGDQP